MVVVQWLSNQESGGYNHYCMYDDDIFIWYDSDLCMRAYLGMIWYPSHPGVYVLHFPPRQSEAEQRRLLSSGQVQP